MFDHSAYIDVHELLSIHSNTDIVIVVLGGDGSLSYVVKQLQPQVTHDKLFFCVVPFGTANSFSQWCQTHRLLDESAELDLSPLDAAIIENVDVWHVSADCTRNGWISFRGRKHQRLQTCMLMDSAIGLQSFIGAEVEEKRRRSRLGNFVMYGVYGIKWLCKTLPKMKASNVIVNNERVRDLRAIEIIVQNLPTIWGQTIDLWNETVECDGVDAQHQDDGKLEVFYFQSKLKYMLNWFHLIRRKIKRIGQFDRLQIDFDKPLKTCFHVDGEFFKTKGLKRIVYEKTPQPIRVFTFK